MDLDAAVKELSPILTNSDIPELVNQGLEFMLGLTADESETEIFERSEPLRHAVTNLAFNGSNVQAQHTALKILTNLSAKLKLAELLSSTLSPPLCSELVKLVTRKNAEISGQAWAVLVNLSHFASCCHRVWDAVKGDKEDLNVFMEVLVSELKTNTLDIEHISSLLSNLSQLEDVRKVLLDPERDILPKLVLFTTFSSSEAVRKGVVGCIRNCCFETGCHEWLLGEQVQILPRLLLPIAGPSEFDDEDMGKLPIDLQYLGPEKSRETNADIRRMLVEALHQLCATPHGRKVIREQNSYVILRELHKWETVHEVILAIEKLVDVLIGDEPVKGMENLKLVDIPEHLVEKFHEIDEALLHSAVEKH